MLSFSYGRATSLDDAITLASSPDTTVLAGGTELLNWARIGIAAPLRVLDIGRIPDLDKIERLSCEGLRIGSLAKLRDTAHHPIVRSKYIVLSQAILKAASAQLRNRATIGGNLLQRTRCPYFRSEQPTSCNKRFPGSGCAAFGGHNEKHAIFGWNSDCVAVQPSDPAVALSALDAVVITARANGGRRIPASRFHVLPGKDAAAHNVLEQGELIVAIELGAPPERSAYLKVRERESYEFATISAAATIALDGDIIRNARIALGSVAMRPWRLLETESLLIGVKLGSAQMRSAIDAGLREAASLTRNEFKITLARNVAERALLLAGGVE